jgi:pyruvate ferredoxin oxidoreductase gamma subunit
MIEIIFHGRGGQGAVVAAQILATAAFLDGKYSHTLPYFRAERKGAPVIAYTRISDEPIEVRGGNNIIIETVDATALSEKIYGQSSIPRVNMAMLGHFASLTKAVKMESVLSAIGEYFTGDNAVKAREGVKLAYDSITTDTNVR